MNNLDKEAWLKEIPELIYKLKLNYNFYYSCFYARINKDIIEIVNKAKHKHKIILYNKNNRFFLVVYKKNKTDIYCTTEYKNDTNNSRIRYFVKKFERAYKKAEHDYEVQQFQTTPGFCTGI